MPLDRVVVSSEEIEQIKPAPDAPPSSFPRLPSPVPWWARISLSPLVLVLPVLCVVAVILRVAFRSQPPRVKYAWVSFLSTLLVVSGILTTVGTVLLVSFAPIPALVNTGLPELDERSQFPTLPSLNRSEQRGCLRAAEAPGHRRVSGGPAVEPAGSCLQWVWRRSAAACG